MKMEKEGQKYQCGFVAFDDNHIPGKELFYAIISIGSQFCQS
jgi:hypothetical protein